MEIITRSPMVSRILWSDAIIEVIDRVYISSAGNQCELFVTLRSSFFTLFLPPYFPDEIEYNQGHSDELELVEIVHRNIENRLPEVPSE
jgi:hypothetical protein